jgi:hypothetical protein
MKRRHTKLIHVGRYGAELDIQLIADGGWSPYISLEDAKGWVK